MIRDKRMQELVAKSKEPITPFIDNVQLLYKLYGTSTIVVIGGSGDYFDVADLVIKMDEYEPYDVTKKAKEIASTYPTGRIVEADERLNTIKHRIPLPESFDPSRGKKEVKISVKNIHTIIYGTHHIDLSYVEQLVDESQTRFIAQAIYVLTQKYMDRKNTIKEVIEALLSDISKYSFDILHPGGARQVPGNYALARKYEIAAAVNRLRSLRMIQVEKR
jgi:predicted ABC-class ATPase